MNQSKLKKITSLPKECPKFSEDNSMMLISPIPHPPLGFKSRNGRLLRSKLLPFLPLKNPNPEKTP